MLLAAGRAARRIWPTALPRSKPLFPCGRRFATGSSSPPVSPPPPVAPPIPAQPPFVVRAALVGTSAGLATPLYAVGGVIVGWYRVLPHSVGGQFLRVGASALIGGGAATLTYKYACPFLRAHARQMPMPTPKPTPTCPAH